MRRTVLRLGLWVVAGLCAVLAGVSLVIALGRSCQGLACTSANQPVADPSAFLYFVIILGLVAVWLGVVAHKLR